MFRPGFLDPRGWNPAGEAAPRRSRSPKIALGKCSKLILERCSKDFQKNGINEDWTASDSFGPFCSSFSGELLGIAPECQEKRGSMASSQEIGDPDLFSMGYPSISIVWRKQAEKVHPCKSIRTPKLFLRISDMEVSCYLGYPQIIQILMAFSGIFHCKPSFLGIHLWKLFWAG